MRLTTDQGPDHWRLHFRRPRVFVDGVEIHNACEIDTDHGYVDRFMTDADGKLIHDGHDLRVERLRGLVRVVEAG